MVKQTDHMLSGNAVSFSELYYSLREKEQRIYTDEEVRRLPHIPSSHPHYREWKIRAKSADRLMKNLLTAKKPLHILEAGCGNGWLANKLTGVNNSSVTGIDIHEPETEQAKRVFAENTRVSFLPGSPFDLTAQEVSYDCIVFAASVQYFPSFAELINHCLHLLKEKGEIHILDTYFYTPGEAIEAKRRSERYYEELGFAEMHNFYFQRTTAELEPYHYSIQVPAFSFSAFFNGRKNIFPYIIISK